MFLFHKLSEEDQHNSIHYCMHLVVEDMLEDGVQLEPFSEEDKRIRAVLEKVIGEAKNLPSEQQFEFVVNHEDAGQIVFDIALDMARSAFYPSDDELVIHYESLRHTDENVTEEHQNSEDILGTIEEINSLTKKNNNSLN